MMGRGIALVADDEAEAEAEGQTIVITVYEPDPMLWDAAFKRRRKS
jgi:hypothetical protein